MLRNIPKNPKIEYTYITLLIYIDVYIDISKFWLLSDIFIHSTLDIKFDIISLSLHQFRRLIYPN